MMRQAILAAAVALLPAAAGAQAVTAEQRSVIRHVSNAATIAALCPDWQVNAVLANLALISVGIPPDAIDQGGAFTVAALAELERADDDMSGMARGTVCAIGRTLFGPDGENVPDLLVRAD